MPIKRVRSTAKYLTEKQEDKIVDIIELMTDGYVDNYDLISDLNHLFAKIYGYKERRKGRGERDRRSKPKRKLSAWNKYVKANSNKKKFQYANGKLKLKKMGIAYRKKRR